MMFTVLLICCGTTLLLVLTKLHRKTLDVGVTLFFLLYFFIFLDSAGVPLMQYLMPLLKRVRQGIGGKTVVALFRILFWYYKHHWDSELEREIYK